MKGERLDDVLCTETILACIRKVALHLICSMLRFFMAAMVAAIYDRLS